MKFLRISKSNYNNLSLITNNVQYIRRYMRKQKLVCPDRGEESSNDGETLSTKSNRGCAQSGLTLSFRSQAQGLYISNILSTEDFSCNLYKQQAYVNCNL